jgi:hypothetical protein
MNRGTYKGVAYDGCGGEWWIAGIYTSPRFTTLAALKRFIDDNTWCCPRNAGG